MKKRKLLYVVEAMGGGVFTYIVAIANRLVETFDIYIAFGVREQTPLNYQECFDDRIKLINVDNFTRSINPVKDIKAFFEIKRIAKEIKPDIIHLHSSKAGALGRFAFNGRKTPMFYTPHGYSFLMSDQNALKRFIYKSIEAVCAKRRCTVISCSEGEHKETLKFTKNAAYINNGIEIDQLEALCQAVAAKDDTGFSVFTLGRISYQKNPKLFNQIALALPDIRFVWIGDGELRSELTAPNIEITGWLGREEALRYSIGADVFVLTSLWEGLPISLLEAMYMKKLCLVSNVIGNRDVIESGVNGFVCETAQDFADKISFAKSSDYSDLTENAYRDILKKYNTDVMTQAYLQTYTAAIRQR